MKTRADTGAFSHTHVVSHVHTQTSHLIITLLLTIRQEECSGGRQGLLSPDLLIIPLFLWAFGVRVALLGISLSQKKSVFVAHFLTKNFPSLIFGII